MLGREITIGGYLPVDSILHRLDPRTKLFCFTILLISVFLASNPHALLGPILLTVIAMLASGLGWRLWMNGLLKFKLMLVVTLLLNLLLDRDGFPVQLWGHITPFSYEGLEQSLFFSLKIAIAVALSLSLTFTTLPWDLVRGLEFFVRPLGKLGISPSEASLVMFLALRFAPLLQEEWRRLIEAQESRGIDFRSGGIYLRSRRFISILAPATTMVFRKSEDLSTAMTVRGFRPGEVRTQFVILSFKVMDYCVISAALFSAMVSVII